VRDTPDREAYRYPVGDQWRSMTWRQSGERARAIAAGLLSLGLDREQRVGILCNTRVEWLLADNPVPPGSILLTGTGLVPPDDFTLVPGHFVEIHASDIGTLVNPVVRASELIEKEPDQ